MKRQDVSYLRRGLIKVPWHSKNEFFFLFFSEQGLTAPELAINYLYTKLLIAKEKHSQLMHITLQKYSGKMKTFLFLVKVFFLTWARQ